MLARLLIAVSAFLTTLLLTPTVLAAAPHILEIENSVPKFETFYADATRQSLNAAARFALWQKEDGLAAVPPGPAGDAMARKLLDAAWDRYPALLPKLPALTSTAKSEARSAFAMVNDLLGTKDVPIHSRLILYVGQFDDNAFTIPPMQGKPATVLMPVDNAILHVALAHELTHSVHLQLVGVKNAFGAPVGETMFLEGLAMRSSQRVVPGLPETAYTQMPGDQDWLAQCYAKKDAVLTGIVADLEKSGSGVAMKYTFGQGNTGMQREVYCAGWIAMGKLLASGKTLREIARIPEERMIATMRAVLAEIR
jgi:hypothetical protein